jgi:ParB family chromosome partitioning protein
MSIKKNALGKGLAALIRDAGGNLPPANKPVVEVKSLDSPTKLPIGLLRAGKYQPRHTFDAEALKSLAASISASGLLQPILVRPIDDYYEIIAGERRFRAAQIARLHNVPVVIRKTSDAEALQIGLIENLQREALNPIEEAKGFQNLYAEFNYSHKEISEMIGKSRPYIANSIRLLSLPQKVQQYILTEKLSAGQGRALLALDNIEDAAEEVLRKNLSVRQIEQLGNTRTPLSLPKSEKPLTPDEKAFVARLVQKLGLPVALKLNQKGAGELLIKFKTTAQIEQVIKKLLND